MGYTQDIEVKMQRHFSRLLENARRGYAAVEAAKLGHGGIEYVAALFSIDPKTVRRGLTELEMVEDPSPGRTRKKGAAGRT